MSGKTLRRTVSSSSASKPGKKMKTSAPKIRPLTSMSMTNLKREYQLARFPIKMSQRVKLLLYNTAGWQAGSTSLAFAFSLSGIHYSIGGAAYATVNFDNTTYLTPVFDEYRIIRVENTMTPSFESFDSQANRWMIPVYSIVDNNDGDIANINDLMGYSNVRKHTLGLAGREYKRVLMTPAVQGSVETTTFGFTTAAAKKVSPWLASDNTTVAHYGMKFVSDSSAQTAWSMEVQFFVEVYFEFRNTR